MRESQRAAPFLSPSRPEGSVAQSPPLLILRPPTKRPGRPVRGEARAARRDASGKDNSRVMPQRRASSASLATVEAERMELPTESPFRRFLPAQPIHRRLSDSLGAEHFDDRFCGGHPKERMRREKRGELMDPALPRCNTAPEPGGITRHCGLGQRKPRASRKSMVPLSTPFPESPYISTRFSPALHENPSLLLSTSSAVAKVLRRKIGVSSGGAASEAPTMGGVQGVCPRPMRPRPIRARERMDAMAAASSVAAVVPARASKAGASP